MESWQIGLIGNTVIMVAYLLITLAIVVPLARGHQLRTNPLGAATGAIFFTCSVHHGAHALHMVLPSLGVTDPQGLAIQFTGTNREGAVAKLRSDELAACAESAKRMVMSQLNNPNATIAGRSFIFTVT